MEKRLILAIALSIIVIIFFQRFTSTMYPQRPQRARQALTSQDTLVPRREPEMKPAVTKTPSPPSVEEQKYVVDTERYLITFSNIGGAITSIQLKDYASLDTGVPTAMAKVLNPKENILSISDPLNMIPGLNEAAYALNVGNGIVTYSTTINNIEVKKSYIVSKSDFLLDTVVNLKNVGSQSLNLRYRLLSGSGMNEDSPRDKRFCEVLSMVSGKLVPFKRPKGSRIIHKGSVGWTALKTKYFSLIVKPYASTAMQYYEGSLSDGYRTGIEVDNFTLAPGASTEHRYLVFAGPSDISLLKSYNLGFEESVTYGVFGGISKLLLRLMNFLYGIFHNWGVSVICLALILNTVLFPLTQKSFKSMQKMQTLQPEMERLKAQHKGNPQKLNKEMMELYKTHRVNPLSGCLPLLLQMPIFISLYQALIRSISLKNASFLWIKDLSQPDALPLPISLPIVGNSINLLPVLMAIAMLFQQKMSGRAMAGAQSKEQAQQQKMMLIMMPVMFGFIFYSFPAGLVLYWLTNTALTVIEQTLIFRRKQS